MYSYIPNTDKDRAEMLKLIGASDVEALFKDIPANLRLKGDLKIEDGKSEFEVIESLKTLAAKNISADTHVCFNGGGIYDHYIPSIVDHVSGRQEFYTAYTPYQAEMSQGTLQVIFEYQTLISRLTGMDVSNASMYDGASACAEAMIMASGHTDRNEVVILGSLNPEYLETCKTYAGFRDITVKTVGFDKKSGTVSLSELTAAVSENTAAVVVQSPNYFGIIEDIADISAAAKKCGALTVACVDPISIGMLATPGELGADIVVGEGQALGNPMNFGGPGFGFFACKSDYIRKMPGRIVGETTDKDGKRGYVLTMQAREQHIRREKATSNICSNQALCSLRATIYLSTMGKEGFARTAELCFHKSHYMYNELLKTGKFEAVFDGPFFKEFTLKYKGDVHGFRHRMIDNGFMPGIVLCETGLDNCIVIAVTEKRTKQQIDEFVRKAGEVK